MNEFEQTGAGFVLHSRAFRETSLVVDVFTEEQGRLSLLFKGVKSNTKRSAQKGRLLQPFQKLQLSWSGRNELRTGRDAEAIGAGIFLSGRASYCGLYLNELILRLLFKEDAHPALFQAYAGALSGLASSADSETILRRFERRLLAEIGFELPLHYDAQTHQVIALERWYHYDPDDGFLPVDLPLHPRIAAECFSGEHLLMIAAENFAEPNVRKDAKRLMRLALAPHLGNKPLESRQLFIQLNPHQKDAL